MLTNCDLKDLYPFTLVLLSESTAEAPGSELIKKIIGTYPGLASDEASMLTPSLCFVVYLMLQI